MDPRLRRLRGGSCGPATPAGPLRAGGGGGAGTHPDRPSDPRPAGGAAEGAGRRRLGPPRVLPFKPDGSRPSALGAYGDGRNDRLCEDGGEFRVPGGAAASTAPAPPPGPARVAVAVRAALRGAAEGPGLNVRPRPSF